MNHWRLYLNVTAILGLIAIIAFLILYPKRISTSPTKNTGLPEKESVELINP